MNDFEFQQLKFDLQHQLVNQAIDLGQLSNQTAISDQQQNQQQTHSATTQPDIAPKHMLLPQLSQGQIQMMGNDLLNFDAQTSNGYAQTDYSTSNDILRSQPNLNLFVTPTMSNAQQPLQNMSYYDGRVVSRKRSQGRDPEAARRRRLSHREVERRRREHINDSIQKISLLIKLTEPGETRNKSEVLDAAIEFIEQSITDAKEKDDRIAQLESQVKDSMTQIVKLKSDV